MIHGKENHNKVCFAFCVGMVNSMNIFEKLLSGGLLVVAVWMAVFFSLSYDPEIRVYIEDPQTEEINVFKSCEGITVTSKEEAADYVVTTELRAVENPFLDRVSGPVTALSVATDDGVTSFSASLVGTCTT